MLFFFFDLTWLKIPWTPLALIGTAVAFVIGFQNNAAYGRIWEARKIWGGIVNTSRTFGMYIQDMVTSEHTQTKISNEDLKKEIKTLTYRHIAWMTALRHAMRMTKPWETTANHRTNQTRDVSNFLEKNNDVSKQFKDQNIRIGRIYRFQTFPDHFSFTN